MYLCTRYRASDVTLSISVDSYIEKGNRLAEGERKYLKRSIHTQRCIQKQTNTRARSRRGVLTSHRVHTYTKFNTSHEQLHRRRRRHSPRSIQNTFFPVYRRFSLCLVGIFGKAHVQKHRFCFYISTRRLARRPLRRLVPPTPSVGRVCAEKEKDAGADGLDITTRRRTGR